ncbi:hypothetical protein [Microbulbifer sp. SAOS-129_SWC]|uniref:hypothetical protein n=1 Tax=Microbulbifer sp. SAOS-129_SWC TaxID=3145235 RepID=UPI0032175AA7
MPSTHAMSVYIPVKRQLAAILILTAALIGQAVGAVSAPVSPSEAAATAMPMDCMDMPAAESSMHKSATAQCGCCPSPGSGCALSGCFYSALPPAVLDIQPPVARLPNAVAVNSLFPPPPFCQLFRPPIA